jgi:hypothetical protein
MGPTDSLQIRLCVVCVKSYRKGQRETFRMLSLLMDANQIRCQKKIVNHKQEEEENWEKEARK